MMSRQGTQTQDVPHHIEIHRTGKTNPSCPGHTAGTACINGQTTASRPESEKRTHKLGWQREKNGAVGGKPPSRRPEAMKICAENDSSRE